MIRTILSQTDPFNMQIDVGARKDQALFDDILAVRNEPYNHSDKSVLEFPFDVYSDQYRLLVDNKSSGCLTVTRALAGPLDCQEYYPQCLFDIFYDYIGSACKLRVLNEVRSRYGSSAKHLAATLIRTAWKDQLQKGLRLDLINVEPCYLPYYSRMGYVLVENSKFIHPTFGDESLVMLLPVDPSRKSIAQDLFQQADDHLFLDTVLTALSRTSVAVSNQ